MAEMEKQTKPLFSKLFRPEVNLSGETTSKNIDFGELNNEPLKAELKQKNLFGRVGFTGTTENNTSYGLGANLTSNKGTITTPKELREYGVPEKIEFGSGKLKANSYDGFLALQDIFGVEGLEARIDAGYTPLEYEKDLKKLALNFKYKFNEGGMAIEKQMEMFEDGGLMQEGGTTDPESGNEVPVGSTQEEVRDDIPAQLSEGEFVFPADVVRFYGLEKLMEMRQRAKAGLQMMEDMGQMGNSEEATLPDDIPFDLEDLDIEDEPEYNDTMEMQVGGFVQPQGFTGIQSTQPSQFQNYQPQYVPYQAPVVNAAYQPPQQQAVPTIPSGQLPQAEQFLQAPQPGEQDLRKYVNDEGQVRMIPFVNDQPVYPIPQGFYPEAEKPVEEQPAPTTVTTETARVREGGGRDAGDVTPSTTDVTGIGYDRSSLTDSLRGVIDDYGFGFAALGETIMRGSSLNIIGNLFSSDPKVGINNLNSAMLGGVIDNFRGGNVTYSDPSRPGVKTGNYSITTPLDQLDPAQQDFLADVANRTAKELQSIFTDEEGKTKTASAVSAGLEAKASDLGISTTLEGTNISKSRTTLIREIAQAVATQKEVESQQKQLADIAQAQKTQAPSEAQKQSQPDKGPGGSYGDKGDVSSAGGKGGYSGAAGAGSFAGMSPRAKGGLIEKPKPKKMKRGGLASKK